MGFKSNKNKIPFRNHESDLKAQRHRYQQELHEKKLEEIEGINEATREQLKGENRNISQHERI